MNKIIFFDTTLRDGEQSPGASLNSNEKMVIAKQLEKLGVNVIEAGFPIASEDDFLSVKNIASELKKPIVTGLARALKKDILRAIKAVEPAKKPRIHTFIGTSNIQLEKQFNLTKKEAVQLSVSAIKLAKQFVDDIEFSAMDATRTEKSFLFEIIEKAIDAGATTINIPDTVGYAQPKEFGDLINEVMKKVPNINEAVISAHCHNDLGLATANSLEAIKNGAKQVEVTINGIGERAGNTALEEIVMALKTRSDYYNGFETSINTKKIFQTSELVKQLTGLVVQKNKAIVGGNAFVHESGIHQDGVLKNRNTYEIMNPEDIGLKQNSIVLGKHSGRSAIKQRLKELRLPFDDTSINNFFPVFKRIVDQKKEITNQEIKNFFGNNNK